MVGVKFKFVIVYVHHSLLREIKKSIYLLLVILFKEINFGAFLCIYCSIKKKKKKKKVIIHIKPPCGQDHIIQVDTYLKI